MRRFVDWFRCENCGRVVLLRPWKHSLPPAYYDVNYWQWVCEGKAKDATD